MNCEEFQRRLDFLLDQHQDGSTDELLGDHAANCPRCAERLLLWSRIDSALSASAVQPAKVATGPWRAGVFAAAVAAATLITTFVARPVPVKTPERVAASQVDSGLPETQRALRSARWDPDSLWGAVRQQDWVNQTLPAVDSMRMGVAPIERSMNQAVAILMNQVGHRDTRRSSVIDQSPQIPFEEQTSNVQPFDPCGRLV